MKFSLYILYLIWSLFLESLGLTSIPDNNSLYLIATTLTENADLLESTLPVAQNKETTTEEYLEATTLLEDGLEDSRESVIDNKLNVVPELLLHKIKWKTRTR